MTLTYYLSYGAEERSIAGMDKELGEDMLMGLIVGAIGGLLAGVQRLRKLNQNSITRP